MLTEDYEFSGIEQENGHTLVRFRVPANNNRQNLRITPQTIRRWLYKDPGHAELLRAFYALEKESLQGDKIFGS